MSTPAPPAVALELRIRGLGFEATRLLKPQEPELVLGRDADCGVCLPDPQRNISRRHLALWNEQGELHFHVLSVVNGVLMPFGEAPPGARGVLAPGQVLQLAEYQLSVQVAAGAPSHEPDDPWAVLERESSGVAALPVDPMRQVDDDPFGEWGFETTFGPGATAGPLQATGLAPAADLAAFFRGLGLDAERPAAWTEGELEELGKLVRRMVLGLLELEAARAQVVQHLHAEDGTRIAPRQPNPLQQPHRAAESQLRYLFAGKAAAANSMPPLRAVHELLADLVAHQLAAGVATRATIENTLQELDPMQLKPRLLGNASKLLDGARAWAAYGRYYAELRADLPAWTQRLLDNYFTPAYLAECERLRRAAGSSGMP